MSDRITKTGKTVLSVFLSATTAVWLTGSAFLVPATAHAQSLSAAQLIELLIAAGVIPADKADAARAVLNTQPAPAPAGKCTFTRGLTVGVTGEDVKCLQKYLNGAGFTIATSGAGSAGSETTYFGGLTQKAVAKWQAANGVAPAVGYFGSISQAKYNALVAGTTPPPPAGGGTTPPPVAGTGLTVSAGTQPEATLAPQGAINVPFTRVKFTASSDGDVKVDSVVVERTGLLDDTAFSGVILLDENGDRIGTAKTLNSAHQVTLTSSFTVKAGQTRELTIAGDMAASVTANQEGYLSLTAVNSAAKVNGTLPIVGSKQRTSSAVSLGTVTLSRGALDPNGAQTKEVGTKSYIFSSLKATAGSNEDMIWKSIRFNQSGSVSATDLKNVVVKDIDGKVYPTTISTDGKYYLANFGTGILIKKGENKEVYIQGDIEDGSSRTIAFDLYKLEDARFSGVDTKYDIRGAQGTGLQAADPRYDASVVTISAGSLRVEKSNSVSAQNVLSGGTQVPLGAFVFEARGEPVTFTQWVLTITTTNGGTHSTGNTEPTNITVYDKDGKAVAGPTDVNNKSVTLADTITIPVGSNIYTVKGNLDSNWVNNDTISLSFTPSSALTTVTGDLTSNTITPSPATSVAGPTMTVKAGALTVTPGGNFSSQTIIRGATGVKLGEYTLDANQSGDDLKVTSIQIRKTVTGTQGDTVNSLIFKDGTTQLNNGSNVKNPTGNTETLTVTLDEALIIPKGTTKTLTLLGNISTTATSGGTFKFDFATGSPDWTVTTKLQGTTVGETLSPTAGATITVGVSGGYTVTVDSSAPSEKWYAAGTKGVTLGVLRFTGTAEDLALTDLRLQVDRTGSSTSGDYAALELWSGSQLLMRKDAPALTNGVEDFIFTDTSCSTVAANCFVIPKDSYRLMTLKADLGSIGTGLSGTAGEYLGLDLAVAADSSKQKATGKQSSASVHTSTASDTTGTGIVMFRTVPTVKKLDIPDTKLTSGNKVLYKFSVAADPAYDLALYKLMFQIATTGISKMTSANFTLYNVTDGNKRFAAATSASPSHMGSYDSSNELLVRVYADTTDYTSAWVTIPAGTTSTFELRGDVTTDGTGDSVSTKLLGDEARTHRTTLTGSGRLLMGKLTRVDTDKNTGNVVSYGSSSAANIASSSSFIWTDFSSDATTTHSAATADWSNGFKVPGLLSTGLDSSTLAN